MLCLSGRREGLSATTFRMEEEKSSGPVSVPFFEIDYAAWAWTVVQKVTPHRSLEGSILL